MNTRIAATAVLLAGAAYADNGAKPNMDVALGLWEVTAEGNISGAPPIPDSLLARLTPEQQAKMQQVLAGRSQPKKYKSCMTPDKLDTGFDAAATSKRTTTVATNTSTEYQAEKQCKADNGTSYAARIHFNLAGKH
jgi:Protein of unknown function (DUF3617)